jgi:hypothetical protein
MSGIPEIEETNNEDEHHHTDSCDQLPKKDFVVIDGIKKAKDASSPFPGRLQDVDTVDAFLILRAGWRRYWYQLREEHMQQ